MLKTYAYVPKKTRNFNKADWGLPEIRLETWDGFIFVNFDRDAAGLMDYLGDLPEQFASYGFGDISGFWTLV